MREKERWSRVDGIYVISTKIPPLAIIGEDWSYLKSPVVNTVLTAPIVFCSQRPERVSSKV